MIFHFYFSRRTGGGLLTLEVYGDARMVLISSTVLPPISTQGLTAADVDELTRTTREKMLAELVSLTETPMGQKAAKAEIVQPGEEDLARLAMKTQ